MKKLTLQQITYDLGESLSSTQVLNVLNQLIEEVEELRDDVFCRPGETTNEPITVAQQSAPKEPTTDEGRCNCAYFSGDKYALAAWNCDVHGYKEKPQKDWEARFDEKFYYDDLRTPLNLKAFIRAEKEASRKEGWDACENETSESIDSLERTVDRLGDAINKLK